MPPDSGSLSGQHIVVTGASSGVGLATATALAARGAVVHAVSRRTPAMPPSVISHSLDLADSAAIGAFCAQLAGRCGILHGLIHCAGYLERKSIADGALSDVDMHFQVNARAPMQLTTALLPQLRAGRGTVVFMNSSAAVRPAAAVASYAMSKNALAAFADVLRAEENANGLRVLTIYLGRTATAMQEKLASQEGSRYDRERLIPPHDVGDLVAATLSLSELTELTELSLRPRLPPAQRS